MEPVYVHAKWQIKKGELDNVMRLLDNIAAATLNEEGNLFYQAFRDNADEHTIMLFEGYADAKSVEAHRNSKHYQEIVVGQIMPLLEAREVILSSKIN